jgi:hypothetical protein
MSRKQIALRLWTLSVPEKIVKARFIVVSMDGNPNFPSPNPPLAEITANVDKLEEAFLIVTGGRRGGASVVKDKELVLDVSLKFLAAYVEVIANSNLETAESMILSAGMSIKIQGIPRPKNFDVSITERPGEVKLITRYTPNAVYTWQYTATPSKEESWEEIGRTTKATIIKSDLQSGTRYHFRVGRVDRQGIHPWSNVLNIIAG